MKGPKPLVLFSVGVTLLISAIFTTAIQLENRDSFCASCQSEPESEYYARALAPPSDLASYHSQLEGKIRCIDSHSDYHEGDDAYTEIPTMSIACDQCHRTLSGWIPPN